MISLYEATVPVLVRAVLTAETILKEAEKYSKANGTPMSDLLDARLAPDMYPMSKQVAVVAMFARIAFHYLGDRELVPTSLDGYTLEQCYTLIADVLKESKDVKPETVNSKETKTMLFTVGSNGINCKAEDCM